MSPLRVVLFPLLSCFFLSTAFAAEAPPPSQIQFKHWYSGIGTYAEDILNDSCSTELKNYYNISFQFPPCAQCRGQALIVCLLDNLDSITLANTASAAVILGLLPSTLSLVGISYVETGLLAQRRPLLAFLLATGSPAVSPIRTFDYRDPGAIMQVQPAFIGRHKPRSSVGILISILEYSAAFAAIVNLVIVTYQLCIRTICSFATNIVWMPILWPLLAILIHLVAMVAVKMRVRFIDKPGAYPSSASSRIWQEFSLSLQHPSSILKLREESPTFLAIAWVISTGTVLHIILGTLVFSSLLFITTENAIEVAAQYLASTLICKMVLVYELAGLQETVDVQVDEVGKIEKTVPDQDYIPLTDQANSGQEPLRARTWR